MSSLKTTKGVKLILGGWLLFTAENLILSENRGIVIERIGEGGYHSIYNTLSAASTLTILYGYLRYGRNKAPLHSLWNSTRWSTRTLAFSVRCAGFIGISQSLPKLQIPFGSAAKSISNDEGAISTTSSASKPLVTRAPSSSSSGAKCPIDFNFGKNRHPDEIWGMKRITRHPQLFSLGLSCFSFALSSNHISHLVFWTCPLLFAFIGGAHQDSRHRRGMGGSWSQELETKTSLIPFQALLEGRQSWTDLIQDTKDVNAFLAFLLAALAF